MNKFYDIIDYFQEEVVKKKSMKRSATDQTNIHKDNEQLVDKSPTKY